MDGMTSREIQFRRTKICSERPTDKQIDKRTGRQRFNERCGEAYWQKDKRTGRETDIFTGKESFRQTTIHLEMQFLLTIRKTKGQAKTHSVQADRQTY